MLELVAVIATVAAAVGGFLAYAHAETKAVAAQEVAIHAASAGHPGAIKASEELKTRLAHAEDRISLLEGDGKVTREVLHRIEKKIDDLARPRRR